MLENANDHRDSQLDKLLRDNEKIKSELRRTREENRKLKHIISYGNLSTLSTLIDQYMDYSRVHLKKIATEIQLTDYEKDSLDKVMELIGHLEHIELELYKLIEIGEEGRIAHNDSLKADVRLAREILPKLEEIIHLHVDSDKSAALEGVLSEFAKRLRKFL